MILEQIKGPEDLKKLTSEELSQLAEEIRAFLIEKISRTGGHLPPFEVYIPRTIGIARWQRARRLCKGHGGGERQQRDQYPFHILFGLKSVVNSPGRAFSTKIQN